MIKHILQRFRNTETHYEETIPLVQEQPYDQFLDSSTVELEQSNAQYDITHIAEGSEQRSTL
jgi:hypothetical protein